MEYKLGVIYTTPTQIIIETFKQNSNYDYVVEAKQLSNNNGNGYCQLQFKDPKTDTAKNPHLNNWTIEARVTVPFNWSGSRVHPKIVDPTGTMRQMYADLYSRTIFKGLSYADDIQAVFDVLKKYSKYSDWNDYDEETLKSTV